MINRDDVHSLVGLWFQCRLVIVRGVAHGHQLGILFVLWFQHGRLVIIGGGIVR